MNVLKTVGSSLILLVLLSTGIYGYDLDDPAEPWREANAGITTQVPPPFEPLQTEGSKVTCWGREYILDGLFPTQITSQEKEMLAGPIQMTVTIGGETVRTDHREVEFGLVREDRIEFAADSDLGPINVAATGWIEYDGVMRVDLVLHCEQPVEVEYLGIAIPLNSEVAKYLHAFKRWGGTAFPYEAIGEEPGWRWTYNWAPYVWIGDDDRGLSFVTESDWGWTPDDGKNALEVERTEDSVVLRVNVLGAGGRIEDGRQFTFGFQATPTKPLPLGWHGRHAGQPCPGVNVTLRWIQDTKWYSYPHPADLERYLQRVQELQDRGLRVVQYISTSFTGFEFAAEQRHHDEWMMSTEKGKPITYQESVEGRSGMTSVCPASSFADWLVWGVDQMMKTYGIDGVYIDNMGPYYCSNELHGCGDHGRRTFPYFAHRELLKRLWTVIKANNPEGIIWAHTTRESNSLSLTFIDIYSDGEQFRDPDYDKNAISLDHITPTFLAITATGRQWGSQPVFLASMLGSSMSRRAWTDWLLARMLPYGATVNTVPSWFDVSREIPVFQAHADFGLDKPEPVEWFTPDRLPDWLPRTEGLLMGAYRRSDGQVLVTASNISDASIWFRFNQKAVEKEFGLPVTITDALTKAECYRTYEGGISIPANSFRMLWLAPAEE